jgi:hypothetical protein
MKFWIPVVSKWQSKQYKTLADVPEGIACVVVYKSSEYLLRQRRDGLAYRVGFSSAGETGQAHEYILIRTLDPLPEPKVSIADLPDGRCFKLNSGNNLPEVVYWKHGTHVVNQDATGRYGWCPIHRFAAQHPHIILDIEMQLQDFPETQSN